MKHTTGGILFIIDTSTDSPQLSVVPAGAGSSNSNKKRAVSLRSGKIHYILIISTELSIRIKIDR